MISLRTLAALTEGFEKTSASPVGPLKIGARTLDVDAEPAVMGCINLSRDSTYRESVAVSFEAAVRRGRTLWAQGAAMVDVGAESSNTTAARVAAEGQAAVLVPVVAALAGEGVAVSVETYHPGVVRSCLQAGAVVVNYTGGADDDEVFDLVAEHEATVILCFVDGPNVRELKSSASGDDLSERLLDYFDRRTQQARARGVTRLVIDPGVGFQYATRLDSVARASHQARVLLTSFRLRSLGLPLCQSLPHAFDLFEDQFRTAEGFFAVLAHLGGAGLLRTHEVAQVSAVLRALRVLDIAPA